MNSVTKLLPSLIRKSSVRSYATSKQMREIRARDLNEAFKVAGISMAIFGVSAIILETVVRPHQESERSNKS